MSPKILSVLALFVLVATLVYMVFRGQLLGGPVTTAVQAAALLLMIWARITFGRRSFHAAANPTEGGLVTSSSERCWSAC
ncbi:MAG TPA: hypothetical protein VH988_36230 [Thermoanaerobaculia bacterium]|jgi:hypothetical protein|nr:hypothetical protein [Thermoanaerobaculia bacterium]